MKRKGDVMLQKKEAIIVLLVGFFCVGTAFCNNQAEKQPEPYENTSVLVEAFVVRVSTEALTEMEVNPQNRFKTPLLYLWHITLNHVISLRTHLNAVNENQCFFPANISN